MIELIVKGGLSYLLGSIVGSLLIGQFRGIDIRTMGSGNAGATNMLRTQGKAAALAVFVIDLGKGWIATGLIAPLTFPAAIVPETGALHAWAAMVCGLAVILGHIYPVCYGFRGGKGFATFVGAVLGMSPLLVLVLAVAWLAVVVLSGYVGLASMVSAAAVAAAIGTASPAPRAPLLAFGLLAALLVVFTHRANIARMRAGNESRAMRLWLLGARRRQG
ncbi:MAG TPA: glycerol-3-phosphate 1-O-acyltransferase PlsY [Steroidobacteraceae bacterium]|nr:glycerol-3-phosphate 1-O-acyltransferase PlsY [Steroidobacteraceae bacterium]